MLKGVYLRIHEWLNNLYTTNIYNKLAKRALRYIKTIFFAHSKRKQDKS